MPNRVTLRDVALYAAVSTATASRVLNGKPNVRSDVRDKVLAAAKELGYGVSVRPKFLALLVPDSENPFFANLRPPFQEVLEQTGYHVLIASSEEHPERELKLIDHFRRSGVAGLFYIAGANAKSSFHLRDSGLPIVVLDRRLTDVKFDFVGIDNPAGVNLILDHLGELGHRSIGFIRGLEGTSGATERERQLNDQLVPRDLELRPEWIWEGDFSFECGKVAAKSFLALESRPTAVFACNDLSALGFIAAVQREGLRVPADVSVIGFDDVQYAAWAHPALSTIAQPNRRIAFEASRLMLDLTGDRHQGAMREDGDRPPHYVQLEPRLMARESTAPPGGG
jgi:DNA-binding LacI/PurR family transcriptional regulator